MEGMGGKAITAMVRHAKGLQQSVGRDEEWVKNQERRTEGGGTSRRKNQKRKHLLGWRELQHIFAIPAHQS